MIFPIKTSIRCILIYRLPATGMEIRLRCHLGLGRYSPYSHAESIALILPEKSSIGELLQMQRIPAGEVGMVVVNGTLSRKDSTLNDGDCVQLYPWLEGG